MKDNPISIGIDDAKFDLKSGSKTTQLIGVVCQGTRMVSVVRDEIIIDGDDSTEKLINLVKQHDKHVQYILTDAITFGGFNICNLEEIHNSTGKPIISVTEREIDLDSVKKALMKKFPNKYRMKFEKIFKAGNLYEAKINTAGGPSTIYFHCKGIEVNEVEDLLQKVCIDSKLPECVRLAHLIGRIF